jgi:hypothetical protein
MTPLLLSCALLQPAPRLDAYGDPLPEGALVRIGTTRLRPGGAVAFSLDGSRLIVANHHTGIHVWDVTTGKQLYCAACLDGDEGWRLEIAPDCRHVAAINSSGLCRILRVPKGTEVCHFGGDDEPRITRVCFAPDGRSLLAFRSDQQLEVYELVTGKRRAAMEVNGVTTHHPALAFAADCRSAYIPGKPGRLLRFDPATGKVNRTFIGASAKFYDAIAESPDGRRVAALSVHGERFEVWDTAEGELLVSKKLEVTDAPLLFTPDGTGLLVPDAAGNYLLWDIATDKLARAFAGHHPAPRSLALAPGGKSLATSDDTNVRVWRFDTAKEIPLGPGAGTGAEPRSTAADSAKGQQAAGEPTRAQFEGLWQDLANDDVTRGYAAAAKLAFAPGAASFAATKLRPATAADIAAIRRWAKDFAVGRPSVRERALAELRKRGDEVALVLQELRDQPLPPDGHERVHKFLADLDEREPSPKHVQIRRALMALQLAADPEARAVLARLAQGAEGALLTFEARLVLRRLP